MIEKLYDYWVVYCDNCEADLGENFETHKEAREAAKSAGWETTRENGHWVNFCPECRE